MRPGSKPPSSVTVAPDNVHRPRGIISAAPAIVSRTVSVAAGSAGSIGVYTARSPTRNGSFRSGVKLARTIPVIGRPASVATGTAMRIMSADGRSNSQPTVTTVKPRFIRNPSPTSGSRPPARLKLGMTVARPRLTMSTIATPLPPDLGRVIVKSEENSTRPSAIRGALSRSTTMALRGSAGSTAKKTRPTIFS